MEIVVTWMEPNCSNINDDRVDRYVIRYGLFSGGQRETTPTVTGMSFMIRNDNLQLFTEYSIEVAAVNSRGVGHYSQPQTAVITGG